MALALFTAHKERRRANRFLACLVLVFTLDMVTFYLDTIPSTKYSLYFELLIWPRDFLYGIFFYFYVRALASPSCHRLSGLQYLHFLPAFLHVLLSWSVFLLGLGSYSIIDDTLSFNGSLNTSSAVFYSMSSTWLEFINWFKGDPESFLMIVHIAAYLFLVYRLLMQHQNSIKQNFSAIEKINLNWLVLLTIGLSLLYLFGVLSVFLEAEVANQVEHLVGCSLVLLIYIMGYCGLRQPLIFSNINNRF